MNTQTEINTTTENQRRLEANPKEEKQLTSPVARRETYGNFSVASVNGHLI